MNLIGEPLVFSPVYKQHLWGGERISQVYARQDAPLPCAEAWEISAHPEGESIINEGRFAGVGLATLCQRFGSAITGTLAPIPEEFPLLFKIIDAATTLSVQIHPDEQSAVLTGGEPKSEMWMVLKASPTAHLYAGLKPGTTKNELRQAVESGYVDQLLNQITPATGDMIYIPGGMIHAIGSGSLIYEIQQSSNTTYRLFDWNRRDAKGNPRELHVNHGLNSINWELPTPALVSLPPVDTTSNQWVTLMTTPYFAIHQLDLSQSKHIAVSGESFHALFLRQGSATVSIGRTEYLLPHGSSALIPADAIAYTITPLARATIIVTTL